jgi:hypothetical protein
LQIKTSKQKLFFILLKWSISIDRLKQWFPILKALNPAGILLLL